MEHSHNIGLDSIMFQVIQDNASLAMCAAKKEIPPIEQQWGNIQCSQAHLLQMQDAGLPFQHGTASN